MYIAIDLALRKIGLVALDDKKKLVDFALLDSNPKLYKEEKLLRYNEDRVKNFLDTTIKDSAQIGLEGLSFNSPSGEIDKIDANHWMVRRMIREEFPQSPITVIPVKSWQMFILTKEVLSPWQELYPVTRAKRGMKLTKEQVSLNTKHKLEIKKLAKAYIVSQVPEDIKQKFKEYLVKNKLPPSAVSDLADAYWLCMYVAEKKNG